MPPQSPMDTREIVEAMVAAINSGRAEAVAQRMHQRGAFVDSLGRRIEGRAALLEGWRGYFGMIPDYRIEVEGMMIEGLEALLHGRARGTVHRDGRAVEGGAWEMPAAWRAVSDGARSLTLWQVFADNKPVWKLLGQ
jgi:ketosteroid isomerase-like protein